MKRQILVIMVLCLAQGAMGMESSENLPNPFLVAAMDGDAAGVKRLIGQGFDVNAGTPKGVTALILASQNGHIGVVKILLDNNANVNAQAWGYNSVTALKQAAQSGHEPIVRLLLENGAEPNEANKLGETPLSIASQEGHLAVVRTLLQYNANVFAQAPGTDNTFPLTQSAMMGHKEIVEALLTSISDADACLMHRSFIGLMAMNRMKLKGETSWEVELKEPVEGEEITEPSLLLKKARQMITQKIIDSLINRRMQRVALMLSLRRNNNQAARDVALDYHHPEIADLLNLNNPESQAKIRSMIEANVRRALFGHP